MEKIAEYIIIELIAKTRGAEVYRARKNDTANTVIIKVLNTEYPSPSELARFKQEYDLIRKINFKGIIQTYDLLEYNRKFALILEDFNGIPLSDVFPNSPFSLNRFLEIAIILAGTIGNLHKANIVHMDIKPKNVLINTASREIKITDFGISAHMTRENEEIYNPEIIRGTLAYMSPEQTGRMNRQVDYRTDLYSLGVTFYEMLTGMLPFISDDPMELIHAHLAKLPTPPIDINPEIPKPVSDIILKLMAKTAEDRYQNSFGLMADLQYCLESLNKKEAIPPFNLGSKDISLKFTIPQKLYGRDAEIQKLVTAFEQTSLGMTNIMFIAGYPGIGKTALINEMQKNILEKKAFFISGKYEQIRRDVPYSAIIQAFQGLIKQLLCENKDKVKQWKTTLINTLSPNQAIIAQMIPDVTHIIGPQPAISKLGAQEFKNRFSLAFKRFIKAFAQEEHPLVFFLDDLQWADLSSLQLLKQLVTSPDIHYLFIIASYRNNEVDHGHPFELLKDEVKKGSLRFQEIELSPLDITDVNQFLFDFLKRPENEIKPFAEIILKKTGGNPFFINQFIKTLYDLKLLRAHPDSGWQWDLENIKQLQLTDNVVDLLSEKIVQLPESTRELLKISACIGSKYNLEHLAPLIDKPMEVIWGEIRNVVNEGYIEINKDMMQFQHDRIREAAYLMIPQEKRKEIHYRIGKYALWEKSTENLSNDVFFITDHLNQAKDLITDVNEKKQLVELNLLAGQKAIYSVAYASALTYLEQGISLLDKDAWTSQYNITKKLHEGAIAAACLGGWYDKMDRYFAVATQNSKNLIDQGPLYEFQILAQIARNNLKAAAETGFDLLEKLGITFPKKINKLHVLIGLIRVKLALRGKTTQDLLNLPEVTDPRILTAGGILAKISTPLFQTNPDLYVLAGFKRLLLSMKYGNTPGAAVSYAAYGVLSCAILEDFDTGYDFGRLAIDVLDRFNDSEYRAQIMMIFHGFIRHWKDPAVESIPPLLEGFQIGKETGKHEQGAYCLFVYGGYLFLVGKPLKELDEIISQNIKAVKGINQTTALNYINMDKQVISNLREGATVPGRLAGSYYNEDDMLPIHHKTNDRSAIAYLYSHKMYLSYLFGDLEDAMVNAGILTDYFDGTRSSLNDPRFYLFSALIRLRQYRNADSIEKRRIRKKVHYSLKKLKKYALHSPANATYAVNLLTAEYTGMTGSFEKAATYFDKAIESAAKYDLIQHEALSNELAAKFYISTERLKLAQPYLRDARYKYEQWGAMAKVKQLDDLYPDTIATCFPRSQMKTDTIKTTRSSSLPTIDSTKNLDIATALKASEAIFGEIVLSRLLKKLMQILIENAGAEKGFIILKAHDTFLVEAEGKIGSQEVDVLKSIPIDHHDKLSPAIVTYAARKKEIILLNDAKAQGEFTRDPYVIKNKPKSILCMPILNQGRLSAVLYLENNLAANVFTSERLRLLTLLSSQIAISIDNARLYENLEQKVEERTHQLKKAQEENLRKAHRAGMADIAKETLHNVGNILTSVKTVADTISHLSSRSALTGLYSANGILQKNMNNLAEFFTHDPKGKKLISYYIALAELFSEEKEKTDEQICRLRNKVDEIVKAIQTLQSHIGSDDSYLENVRIKEEIQFVMETKRDALLKSNIQIEEKYKDDIPTIKVQKSKFAHILDNLINNAREAMENQTIEEKRIILEVEHQNRTVVLRVKDTGIGISEENIKKIFFHGFTTKNGRYGHNLHNCANNMTEMGGKISAYSKGKGKGAVFTLEFPVQNITAS